MLRVSAVLWTALGLGLVYAPACGLAEIVDADTGLGGGPGGSADASGDATLAPDARANEDAGPPPPPGCDFEAEEGIGLACLQPGEDGKPVGLFVSATAAAGGDGTRAKPFQTFAEAMANLNGLKTIFAASGEYNESIVSDGISLSIFGGFTPTFDNAPPRATRTVVRGVGAPALTVQAAGQTMRFQDVDFIGADVSQQAGASSIGVLLRSVGADAYPVSFRRCTLASQGAGAGAAGTSPPAESARCGGGGRGGVWNGTTWEAPLGGDPPRGGGAGANNTGSCAGATKGADGSPGGDGSPATFGSTAWSFGADGLSGSTNQNVGTAGSPGGGGGGGGGGKSTVSENNINGGNGGNGGCGGQPGGAGAPGAASVALQLVYAVNVQLRDTQLRSGTGGPGGAGGAGGEGAGGDGGDDTICLTPIRVRGGDGGQGGRGGAGSGGQGGPSLCALLLDTPALDLSSALCNRGNAGAGAGSAPPGETFEQARVVDGNLVAP